MIFKYVKILLYSRKIFVLEIPLKFDRNAGFTDIYHA